MNKELYMQMANDETFPFKDRMEWFLDRAMIPELLRAWNAINAKKDEDFKKYPFTQNAKQASLINQIFHDVDLQRYFDAFGTEYMVKHISRYNSDVDFITMTDKGDIITIEDLFDYLDWCDINEVIIKFMQQTNDAVDTLTESLPELPKYMEDLLKEYQSLIEIKDTLNKTEMKEGDFLVLWIKESDSKRQCVRVVNSKKALSSNFEEMISHYVTNPNTIKKYVKTFDKVHYLCESNLTAGCYLRNFNDNEVLLK